MSDFFAHKLGRLPEELATPGSPDLPVNRSGAPAPAQQNARPPAAQSKAAPPPKQSKPEPPPKKKGWF